MQYRHCIDRWKDGQTDRFAVSISRSARRVDMGHVTVTERVVTSESTSPRLDKTTRDCVSSWKCRLSLVGYRAHVNT